MDIFTPDGSRCLLDTPAAIEVFTQWTELYTKYKVDKTLNETDYFRTGEAPIVLSVYTLYNTLSVSAPEIKGLWGMAPVPGIRQEDGSIRRKTRSKSGFRAKKEALEYLPLLAVTPAQERSRHITCKELYDKWYPTHRAGESTLGCYRAAIKHFRPLWSAQLADIDVDDLQECMDDCPAGKRIRENMKALCGLLYKYAIPGIWRR